MDIPFTIEQFFEIFGRYNESVWPAQIGLNMLALAAVGLLFTGHSASDRVIAIILGGFWLWMAVAYHLLFFAAINPAAWVFGLFFLTEALWIIWLGAVQGKLHFRVTSELRGMLGITLLVFSLVIYPVLGYLLGHHYPYIPTFGLPCPTTIFTLGTFLMLSAPIQRSVFIVPLLWTAVGSVAAFKLGVLQDLSLLAAGMIGLYALIMRARRA